MRTAILAAFIALSAIPAAAQVNPQNLPASTVYGRLGIGAGPGQAIPFATLGAQAGLGNVVGPLSATDGHLAVFNGATGQIIKDGGVLPALTVTCNNNSGDQTLLQAAINTAVAANGNPPVRFAGVCSLPSSGLTISGPIDFGGVSVIGAILEPGTSVAAITINTNQPVSLHDFSLIYPTPASAAVQAITVTAPTGMENTQSRFDNLNMVSCYYCIFSVKANSWNITNTAFEAFLGIAVVVENLNNVDSGGNGIYGNQFVAATGAGGSVDLISGGGLRVVGNVINGVNSTFGVEINLANGASTSDLIVMGNAMEGFTTTGSAAVYLVRSGTTGAFLNVQIIGNEMSEPQYCVQVPTDANGAWLSVVTITGNVCLTSNTASAVAISLDSLSGASIANNTLNSINSSTKPFAIGAGVAGLTWDNGALSGTFAAGTLNASATSILGIPEAVAQLPTCAALYEGRRASVTDQNTAVSYRGAVTGSGSTKQGVICSNSSWLQD